jgi:hypothetical protein
VLGLYTARELEDKKEVTESLGMALTTLHCVHDIAAPMLRDIVKDWFLNIRNAE